MKHHTLKIKAQYADAYLDGLKPWELRENDRGYQVGDRITFVIPDTHEFLSYDAEITYIHHGGKYGLAEGYCIMTLNPLK